MNARLVAAYVLGAFLGPDMTPSRGAGAGAAAGLFWVSGSIATNYGFERASLRLWLINGGHHTIRLTMIGLSFGLLG